MGQSVSGYVPESVSNVISRKRKRADSYSEDSGGDCLDFVERTMHTPKRKKLMSTSEYIYQALYKEGLGSDVNVVVLGKTWKLHRIYLSQSPYFRSMFSGSWKETGEETIQIEVVDPNITVVGLDLVLGSLYMNEITLKATNVIPTLATASLFQLEGVIDKCVEVMRETVNFTSVIEYHYNAEVYCLDDVKESTYNWLQTNLMGFMSDHPEKLKEIGAPLMIELITDPDLFVLQIEFYIYNLLRYWMFLKLDTGSDKVDACKEYFCAQPGNVAFLLTERGLPFVPVFKHLRFFNLMAHHMDVEKLKYDKILPWNWLAPYGLQQWNQMLRLDHGPDSGPRGVSDAEFLEKCVRCGRLLKTPGDNVWRWTGYNFGLDLIWSIGGGIMKLRRNHELDNSHDLLLSQRMRRHFILRVTLISLDKLRQVEHSQTTGIRAFSLAKNQEILLLDLEPGVKFPLHVSVNILVTTPYTVEELDMSTEESGDEEADAEVEVEAEAEAEAEDS